MKSAPASKLLFILMFISCQSFAQVAFELPPNYEFQTKADYVKYEQVVVDAAKWLEYTDLNKEVEKRKGVNAFVIQYVSGSSIVSVEINEQLLKICGKNEQLLSLYIAAFAAHAIQHKNAPAKNASIKAGLTSIMNVYKRGIDISKSKEMDKIIRLTEVELNTFISERF